MCNPLNQKETGEYISSRLHKAGMGNSCFTEKAVDEIFGYSKGIPRVINILCDNSLTTGYATDEKKIDENIVKEVIADLETCEKQSAESTEAPTPKNMAEASNPEEKRKNPRLAGQN